MRVHHGPPDQRLGPSSLAIGSFDGVHLGHREIISRLIGTGLTPVVMTFEPHPRCLLDPDNCPATLTTLDEKAVLMQALGVEHLVILQFDRALADLSAADFMSRVIAAGDLRRLVVGADFALGRGRHGDIAWLREFGSAHGFEVEVVDPVEREGREVRSSELRKLLTLGDVASAARILGREYSLTGVVEHGFKVGRELGFPTVNVSVEARKLVPGRGVYAGRVRTSEGAHTAAISVGYRPTFGGTRLTVEAFLLDFQGDLYQQTLEVSFTERLRDEVRFAGAAELAVQIALDVAETRRIVGGA